MDGVAGEPARIPHVLAAPLSLLRDRDEEEVRGYSDALAWAHHGAEDIPLDEAAIRRLHAITQGRIRGAGQYKDKDGDISERHADGSKRMCFEPSVRRRPPR